MIDTSSRVDTMRQLTVAELENVGGGLYTFQTLFNDAAITNLLSGGCGTASYAPLCPQ
jgi:hypothetical protein